MTETELKSTAFEDEPKNDNPSKDFGGSPIEAWNHVLIDQAINSLWIGNSPADKQDSQVQAAMTALLGVRPRDELEGMMAAQLFAAHSAAMECYRRAMIPGLPIESRRSELNQATKLSRTHAALVGALDKRRGKGQQKVTVEHVHVHAGGQAVVGVIGHGGGANTFLEEQPYAQQITYAPEPTLWSDDKKGDSLPIPCDEEWSLPDAWWEVTGGPKGKF
ncbi:hypothetical protein P6F26_13555 [Roseibacterium sp. SDUM158017]|uniref:hypothetical protein n=1 Tax=Roseicyclus salinarum TaxID=3036773 RepID=UPI002414EA44|nr:hypothetical protein [Roseibacterium sp. SDUM158017]MDG4649465.1 hypothetical protein [Roseibacterium sp. SDUM158017]